VCDVEVDPDAEARKREQEAEERRRALAEVEARRRLEEERRQRELREAAIPPEAKRLHEALISQRPAETREALRDIVKRGVPGATSKDIGRTGASTYRYMTPDDPNYRVAMAYHDWTGEVVLRDSVKADAETFAARLARGEFGPGYENAGESTAAGRVLSAVELKQFDAMTTLVHEELHGHSRMTSRSYIGIGAVLEEVGTELNARHLTLNLTPNIAANPALRQELGPFARRKAYEIYINRVTEDVAAEAGVTREAAARAIRDAHRVGVLSDGPEFRNSEDHLSAFVAALPYSEQVKRSLLPRLRRAGQELRPNG